MPSATKLVLSLLVACVPLAAQTWSERAGPEIQQASATVPLDQLAPERLESWVPLLRSKYPSARLIYAVLRQFREDVFTLGPPSDGWTYTGWLASYRAAVFRGRIVEFVITPTVVRTRTYTPGVAVQQSVRRARPFAPEDDLLAGHLAWASVGGRTGRPALFLRVPDVAAARAVAESLGAHWRIVLRSDACFGPARHYALRNPFEPGVQECPADPRQLSPSLLCDNGCRYLTH